MIVYNKTRKETVVLRVTTEQQLGTEGSRLIVHFHTSNGHKRQAPSFSLGFIAERPGSCTQS